jgi:hypothetical protein
MKRSFCLKLVAALAVLFVGASLAVAQTGAGSNPPSQKLTGPTALPGSEWTGEENLQGFGKLTFRFLDEEKVLMIDAQSQVQGSYTLNGQSVQIQFRNCVYEGTIQDNVLSGSARFTQGQSNGVSWTFSVQFQSTTAP